MAFNKANLVYGILLGAIFILFQTTNYVQPSLTSPEAALCLATYYTTYTSALAQYPKAQLVVNKFFFNGTCLTQCLLKSGKQTVQTLNPIQSPNFTPCGNGGNKLNKQKMLCFDGVCSTIAQIAAILGTTTTTTTTAAAGRFLLDGKNDIHLTDFDNNRDNSGNSIPGSAV